MNTRILLSCASAVAILSGVHVGAEDSRATEVLAQARKAIGGTRLDSLKTLTIEATVQRNLGTMQLSSETEILLELPSRYLRTDTASGPMSGGLTSGFNGDTPIRPAGAGMSSAGGGMVVRFGPAGPMNPPGEKLSPEEQERMDAMFLRSARVELSRLMLGWFAAAHPSLGAEMTHVGEAESPDGKADVISVKGAEGFAARLFIDRETRLPLMLTYEAPLPRMVTIGGPPPGSGGRTPAEGRPGDRREPAQDERRKLTDAAEKQLTDARLQPPQMAEYTLYFDDWRDVGGIRFPHVLRRASGGTTNEEWIVRKVRVNPRIDPKRFEG